MTIKSNADRVAAELEKRLVAAIEGAKAGLYLAGSVVMTEAKKRAPLDLGTLRGSGYVTLPRSRGEDFEIEAGFGGAAKDYAVVQHERLDFRHEEGEAKFLENAIEAKSEQAGRVIQREVQRALKVGAARHPRRPFPEAPT